MKRVQLKAGRPPSAEQRVASPVSPPMSPAASPRLRKPMATTADQILYAQPASVHFGGFQLDRPMQQRVRVHNNSARAVRLRYTFPMGKKGFRATFASADRPSFVSAGLCEEILVSFTPPAGFQYYYDCIQVRCEEVAYGSSTDVIRGGATLIPLHAYPVVNEVSFPTRMDFGVVPRGTCARRQVAITCSVPVEFEYELRVTKPHPAFTIFPLTGCIPPRGEARIELEFRPTLYATASAELELHVSQLSFVPRACMLAGSSSSTAVDASSVVEVVEQRLRSATSPRSEEKAQHRSAIQKKSSRPSTPRGEAKTSSRHTTQEEPPFENCDGGELEKVRGIEIPHDLNSVTSVSFVLNQEPGKLKPKDLKKAISANRSLRQQQREEQVKLSSGNNSIGEENEEASMLSFRALVREEEGYLERAQVSKQVKDMFFQQELGEVSQAEKALEFQSHKVHLGQRLLSNEQLAYLTHLRYLNSFALARQQRDKLRATFVNIRYNPPVVSDHQQKTSDEEQLLLLGELKTSVLTAHFVPAYTPDFKTYKNDLWARRQRVLRRLVRAVSRCVIRLRAQKRFNRIRAWLGSAKTREQVREKVALDWQRSTHSSDNGVVIPESTVQATQAKSQGSVDTEANRQCYLSSFPLVEESTAQKCREPIDLPPDWDLKFNSLKFLKLKPRDEALLMGHEPLPLPTLPTYVPLKQSRKLRQGAAGECGVLISLLLPPVAASDPASAELREIQTPSLLELMPHDAFLRPQASVRPCVDIQSPRETDPSYALRPQRVFRSPPSTFSAWQSSQIGLQSIVGSHDSASLCMSDVFVATAERKQVEPLFPAPIDNGLLRFGDIWNVATAAIPTLAAHAEDVPCLSDSESDNDGDNGLGPAAALQVNWKRAVTLFEDSTEEQQGGKEEISRGDPYEDGELLGRAKGVYSFERYRHLIRQERSYNVHRQDLLERLPKLLEAVASQIEHPDYTLVVQGHGPDRTLHNRKPDRN